MEDTSADKLEFDDAGPRSRQEVVAINAAALRREILKERRRGYKVTISSIAKPDADGMIIPRHCPKIYAIPRKMYGLRIRDSGFIARCTSIALAPTFSIIRENPPTAMMMSPRLADVEANVSRKKSTTSRTIFPVVFSLSISGSSDRGSEMKRSNNPARINTVCGWCFLMISHATTTVTAKSD